MRKESFILALVALWLIGAPASVAQAISVPGKPAKDAYPAPFGYLRFYATSFTKLDDGRAFVQYGYIFAALNGHVVMHLENDAMALKCVGEAGRADWPATRSVVDCTTRGKPSSHSVFEVEGGTSKGPRGEQRNPVLDAKGRKIGEAVLRWSPFRFPKYPGE